MQGSHTRSNAGGTGIGLAICRAIVKQHDGTIHAINNTERAGSTFIARLPAPAIIALRAVS